MIGGVPLHAANRKQGSGTAAIDPATLSLTGWWRGSYSGSPWSGNASAGSSSGRSLSAENSPDVGSPQGGFTSAFFVDSNNDRLTTGLGVSADNLVSLTAYTISMLIKPGAGLNSIQSPVYSNPTIIADNGSTFGVVCGLDAPCTVRFYHYDTSHKSTSVSVSDAAWSAVDCRFNGSQISVRVNGGAWSSVAAGTLSSAVNGQEVRVGCSADFNFYFDGDVMELLVSDAALSDATLDGVRAYYAGRYGVAV